MSLDMDEFLRYIKQAAIDAIYAMKPFSFLYGTVISPEPDLEIFVNQKLTLDEQQLILTNNVRDYTIYMTTAGEAEKDETGKEHYTEDTGNEDIAGGTGGYTAAQLNCFASHNHKYVGKKKWTVHLALKTGEKVTLLRCDGGQKYIVLDRVEAPNE